MATFMYFLPGVRQQGFKAAMLADHRIDYAFGEPCDGPTNLPGQGPDGGPGLLTRVRDKSMRPDGNGELPLAYLPNEQTWRKVAGSTAWVGFWNDARPKPADLVRKKTTSGVSIRLLDENDWLIPIATSYYEAPDGTPKRYTTLPTVCGVDDEGNWTDSQIEARCQRLFDIAEKIWPVIFEFSMMDGGISIDFGDHRNEALEVFQHNYRIGKTEIAMLGLCTTDDLHRMLMELVDWPTAFEYLKKKIEGTPSAT